MASRVRSEKGSKIPRSEHYLEASATALAASFMRAVHARCDWPTIVDDPYGDRLLTPPERSLLLDRLLLTLSAETRERIAALADPERALDLAVHATPAYAHVLVRARYAEDVLATLVARGVRQYVLVGAGMDTLALRRRDLRDLQIFEVDHPASQALKHDRLARAGLEPPPNLHFVPLDLERGSVPDALVASGYRLSAPALVACLGVVGYLTRDANLRLLRDIASSAAPGTELVFDFLDTRAFARGAAEETSRMVAERDATDEPLLTGFDPDRLGGELATLGLTLVECLDPARAQARYCAGREDDLRVPAHVHIARAVIRVADAST